MNKNAANGENEMTYMIRLNVRGCTTEQYAEAALQVLRNENISGEVVRVTRTAKGATVAVKVG